MSGCSFAIIPAREISNLGQIWTDLQARSDHSYFQTWAWIGTWLAELPRSIEPLCLMARRGTTTVALGLFVSRSFLRLRALKVRALYLHETGQEQYDRLTVEYNGLLVARDAPSDTARACIEHLQTLDWWDEIHFSGSTPRWKQSLCVPGLRLMQRHESPCHYLDLQGTAGASSSSGSGTAYQIRRARRLYGDPVLEVPSTRAEAMDIFSELKRLHQDRWVRRGQPGAFGSDFLNSFHERLTGERWLTGEIQLLRTAGRYGTIGCLYNFVYQGCVYSYQGGFAFGADNRLKPGLVTHQAAIDLNRTAGMTEYDFLAGDARYKRDLANRARNLHWLVLQRPRVTLAIEAFARRAHERAKSVFPRRSPDISNS